MTLTDMHPAEAYAAARAVAADYSVSMGDPMYAFSSSGAIVYAGRAVLALNLRADEQTAYAEGYREDAEALGAFASILEVAISRADVQDHELETDDGWLAYGARLRDVLTEMGVEGLGDPVIERGWSRGPRAVIPRTHG